MSRMYVTYDGNFGSAADGDLIIFDTEDLNEDQLESLENDPENFYSEIGNKTVNLIKITMPVYDGGFDD